MKAKALVQIALLASMTVLASTTRAEDVDIFNQPPGVSPDAPNILFILDNSSNWSRASQQWVGSATQGDAEIKAIKEFIAGLTTPANIGLMMMPSDGGLTGPSNPGGGYMRFGIRSMSVAANSLALRNIVGGIDVNDNLEKVNEGTDSFENALYETWLYLNGSASYASGGNQSKTPNRDYPGNSSSASAAGKGLTSGFAYQSSAPNAVYNSPLSPTGCAKTYIILIGNNRNGTSLPYVASGSEPAQTTLNTYGYGAGVPDPASAWARFLKLRPDLAVGSPAFVSGSVTTYTIDAYKEQSNPTFTTILKNIAKEGGGLYYQAGSDVALKDAFDDIFTRIQAVNSVFSAVSLPVAVSVRGSFDNQVYLGVFRPNAALSSEATARPQPQWTGNLKLFQLAKDGLGNPFLVDSSTPGKPVNNANTGFIAPNVTSFWTKASPAPGYTASPFSFTSPGFWDPTYYLDSQGVGKDQDLPDGNLVEKGGAAQYLRDTFKAGISGRPVYTCTGTCTTNSLLSGTPFNTTNATQALLGASDATDATSIVDWVKGANTVGDDNPSPNAARNTYIRGFVHGDVLHSRAAAVDYGTAAGAPGVVVFYGANDGLFHAIQGGLGTNGGTELWSFVAPEHFSGLKRLRDHSPGISLYSDSPRTAFKPYFMDGSPATYIHSPSFGATPDKVYLYLTTRRGTGSVGGSPVDFMYALDVTTPTTPKLLWKRKSTDAGFGALSQTWSQPQVVKIKGNTNPVVIMGMGYDAAANDPILQTAPTKGRGVMVIDAFTGSLIWQAGASVSGATTNLTVAGMTYDIPADVTTFDSDLEGNVDRVYAADTGGNIWRINMDDASPSNWTVDKLASLSGGVGSGANARKFLFAVDLVRASAKVPYDALLIGSGDREHPFDTTISNRFYMIKDSHALNYRPLTPITEGTAGSNVGVSTQLLDVSSNLVQVGTAAEKATATASLATSSGWYVILGTDSNGTGKAGEKVVGGATTANGTVFFGTNSPATAATNACTSNLGEARLYSLSYIDGSATIDRNLSGTITTPDRSGVQAGGGLPPTPVAGSISNPDGTVTTFVCFGTTCLPPPGGLGGRRYQHYWRKTKE